MRSADKLLQRAYTMLHPAETATKVDQSNLSTSCSKPQISDFNLRINLELNRDGVTHYWNSGGVFNEVTQSDLEWRLKQSIISNPTAPINRDLIR